MAEPAGGIDDAAAIALVVTDAPSAADVALIETELSAFNRARYQPYDKRALCVLVEDAAGRRLGGLTGHTLWGWLYLDCFWLPDDLRQEGLGGRILAMAEAEALARGCARARLFTYSFQAQGFYEKHGYRVYGRLDDYPPGEAMILMRKDLGLA